MIILTIRTDKTEAEIGLYDDDKQLSYEIWEAHRHLSETIHRKIEELLQLNNRTWQDIQGIVCFQGPGSFTGLRIGLTVGNSIAYSYSLPIVAMQDPSWLESGVKRLLRSESDTQTMPFYGADAHITPQKK
jgi:tRNA threonylcarbamoyladenosine biosynthesis protein TsaB